MVNLFAKPKSLQQQYDEAHEAWTKARDKHTLAAKDAALKALTDAGQAPAQCTAGGDAFTPGIEEYNTLLRRVRNLGLPDNWLNDAIRAESWVTQGELFVEITGWKLDNYRNLAQEIEHKRREIDKAQKAEYRKTGKVPPGVKPQEWPGPIAPVGMSAKPIGDGTYTWYSDIHATEEDATAEDYHKVCRWAETFGVCRATVAMEWGALGFAKGALYTKTNLVLLQKAVVFHIKEKGTKMNLFAKAKMESNIPPSPGGEATHNGPTPEERAEIAKRLGIHIVRIETRDHVDRAMQFRSAALAEFALIEEQYRKGVTAITSELSDWDRLYKGELSVWFDANCPEGKKTLNTLYGDLKRRDIPESIALDEDDTEEQLLQAWLHTRSAEEKLAYGIVPYTRYGRDLEKIKTAYKAGKIKQLPPGLRHKEAEKDRFSIGPSMDTIRDRVKKAIKAEEKQ